MSTSGSSDLSLLDGVMSEYSQAPENLITILQKAQDIYGYLPVDVIYYIAQRTGVKPAKIMGVATFYSQFRLEPVGKYLILLCNGTACHVNGSEEIERLIGEKLFIQNGDTTADGLFSLRKVSCLGCCSLSPVMMINDEAYGSLTPEKVIDILDELARNARQEEGL
ncbi:MAG: NADH-quinone oxidoreductase subunit NuoE [Clostridiales bacterium]|jgi:NADH-quinone oxidoreductase subunit E|nr:NADH-quinone oxidoreductase subunit NuoE [Clostridiales bacterium]